jgi:hypothetical protein
LENIRYGLPGLPAIRGKDIAVVIFIRKLPQFVYNHGDRGDISLFPGLARPIAIFVMPGADVELPAAPVSPLSSCPYKPSACSPCRKSGRLHIVFRCRETAGTGVYSFFVFKLFRFL